MCFSSDNIPEPCGCLCAADVVAGI